MKSLLPFLLLAVCSPAWGQTTASAVIQSNLIVAPDEVSPGKLISILLPPDLPFEIEPKPENKLSFIDEESGKRAYLILEAKPPGYTITIDYAVIHPTEEQIKTAPWDDRGKFAQWLAESSRDEIYKDSRFVKVGEPEPPEPPDPPTPPPGPTDPIAKSVFDAALKVPAPRKESAHAVAKIYRNVASRAAGLSEMTVAAMADSVKEQTRQSLDAAERAKWVSVGEVLDDLADRHAKDRQSAIETYNKFAEGLEAVQ